MATRDYSIPRALLESVTALRRRGAVMIDARLIAIAAALILASNPVSAATITVNSLADPGASGICALRDAITAANTQTRVNGCKAGSGNDTIQFRVSRTILLADTLPQVTDSQLTIKGPITLSADLFPPDGGGGLFFVASGATVKLQNLTIENGLGSILSAFFNEGTLTIDNSTISGNGPSTNDGTLTVTNTTFSANTSLQPTDPGAIINKGTLTITNSTFSGNGASGPGAINNFGTLTITNSTFSGNGSEFVGAIFNHGTLAITNSTFYGNVGSFTVGAIWNNDGGIVTVTNSTFSNNMSNGQFGTRVFSGAIFNESGSAIIKNTIFAASTNFSPTMPSNGSPISNCQGTLTDAGYNISDDNSCGFARTGTANNGDDVNPTLSSDGLTNNGGPTQTIALFGGSPAIDAIPVADCTDQNGKRLKTDQRGFPRPDAGESVCDIGAFETQDGCSQSQQGNNNCQ
jgi:CSLREA domain-containing protein